MQGQKKQPDYIENRHVNILKSINHHRINIVAIERVEFEQGKLRVELAGGEMEQVKDDEGEHDQSADDHVARRPACFHVVSLDVWLGSSAPIFDRELNRRVNVNCNCGEQKNSNCPQQRAEVAQMLRVTVDPIGSEKDLQVPEQMADNEKNQNDAGDRDDHFFSNRRAIEGR